MIWPFPLQRRKASTLALATAASLLELAPIVALLHEGSGLASMLFAGLAYQIGNVAPRPRGQVRRIGIATIAVVGAAGLFLAPNASAPWLVSIALLSWSLQTVRRRVAVKAGNLPTTMQKRAARVLGFAAASILPLVAWLSLLGLTLIAALALPEEELSPSAPRLPSGFGHSVEWTMLVHQMHYFSYCYAIPMLAAHPSLGGVPMTGVWFAIGWVSYLSAETLWQRFLPSRVFLIGHGFLAVILALMAMVSAVPWLVIALWILSGLGGGTVYCITLRHREEHLAPTRLEHAEDAGHLLGVLVALAGVMALDWEARVLPAVGSLWATCAVGIMLVTLAHRESNGDAKLVSNGGVNADQ